LRSMASAGGRHCEIAGTQRPNNRRTRVPAEINSACNWQEICFYLLAKFETQNVACINGIGLVRRLGWFQSETE
jgi:hypothetical protein